MSEFESPIGSTQDFSYKTQAAGLPVTKNRILFLDDRSRRIHQQLARFPETTIVTTVKETLRFLSKESWDIVDLDFDLGGDDFTDPESPECGMEIVRYIEKCGGWPAEFHKKPRIIIHSKNAFGAELMFRRFLELGFDCSVRPFIYD